jgi:hypothetical protein
MEMDPTNNAGANEDAERPSETDLPSPKSVGNQSRPPGRADTGEDGQGREGSSGGQGDGEGEELSDGENEAEEEEEDEIRCQVEREESQRAPPLTYNEDSDLIDSFSAANLGEEDFDPEIAMRRPAPGQGTKRLNVRLTKQVVRRETTMDISIRRKFVRMNAQPH